MWELKIRLTGEAERVFKEMVERFAHVPNDIIKIEHNVLLDAFVFYDRACVAIHYDRV